MSLFERFVDYFILRGNDLKRDVEGNVQILLKISTGYVGRIGEWLRRGLKLYQIRGSAQLD